MMILTRRQKQFLVNILKYIDEDIDENVVSMIVKKDDSVIYLKPFEDMETLQEYTRRVIGVSQDLGSNLFFLYSPRKDENLYEYVNMVLPDIKKFLMWKRLKEKGWEHSDEI